MRQAIAAIGTVALLAWTATGAAAQGQATGSGNVNANAAVGPANSVAGVQGIDFGAPTPANEGDDVTVTIDTHDNTNAGYFSVWTNRRGTTVDMTTLENLACTDAADTGCNGAPDITVAYTCAWTDTNAPVALDLTDHVATPGDCTTTSTFTLTLTAAAPETLYVFLGGQITVDASAQLAGNYQATIEITATSPAL